ncbi:MAG: LamG domain-containing protein [Patescibacteria group bacterium]|nr:LamG domain-containing protein [Patescibacteria group bacterium]
MPVINDGNWHFIAVELIDAKSNIAGFTDNSSQYGSVSSCYTTNGNGYFNIGTGNPAGINNYLQGIISDVRIYNTLLTPAQIKAIYNAKQ